MTARRAPSSAAASKSITKRIRELGDWRGETLARVRQLIHDADPDIQEEWKWMGTPVWSQDGGVCTAESYKQVVKLTFFRGASLPDPRKLFNSSLEGNARRAIDIREGEKLAAAAFKALIRAAVVANSAARARRASPRK
jgi:hypothetical protein